MPVLFVCGSCDRERPQDIDSRGQALAAGIKVELGRLADCAIEIRVVACLNGCRSPCNVALRGAGRWTYRFSRCTLADTASLISCAMAYWATPDGELSVPGMPSTLRDKLSAHTAPPGVCREVSRKR